MVLKWEEVAYFSHKGSFESPRFVGLSWYECYLNLRVQEATILMFIGEYTHTLDPKKRLALPSKFRKELGRKAVVTKGLDNCLFVYTTKEWEKEVEKISNLSTAKVDARNYMRNMLSGAYEMDVDSMGRILIPEALKVYGGLDTKVSVLGVNNRIEIWNEKRWDGHKKKIEKEADALAEKLGESGAI